MIPCLGLDGTGARSGAPGERLTGEENDDEKLGEEDVEGYRAMVARANYPTQDRLDIFHCAKELAREVGPPRRDHGVV